MIIQTEIEKRNQLNGPARINIKKTTPGIPHKNANVKALKISIF
jgi:hypothetical protein